MIRVYPQIDDTRLMELFRKGVEGQWSAETLDWEEPLGLDRIERGALAAILSPVYMGEQTAMLGASAALPQFFAARETEAQLYLSTFLLDEARHFEILTRFYDKIGERPLEVRDLRDMFRYHARLYRSKDRVEWLWGILLSDVIAKHFYGSLVECQPKSLFAQIASRILKDEARHLAFTELYLKSALERQPEMAPRFLGMRDDLLRLIEAMCIALKDPGTTLGLDMRLFEGIAEEFEKKAERLGLYRAAPDEL
jgi:hypothetical protein